jgi:hypothetical protein
VFFEFSNTQLTTAWQWVLMLVAVYVFILSVIRQLRTIRRFPRIEKSTFLGRRNLPMHTFLLFLLGGVLPWVVPMLASSEISQLATIIFALGLASSFACWLFIDNERGLKQRINQPLFRIWLGACGAFTIASATLEMSIRSPRWVLYAVSLCTFVAISRMTVSACWNEMIMASRAIPSNE